MPVRSVLPDNDALTLTIVADYPVTPAAAWRIWADPALLGGWWGPPGYPCTVDHHELVAGGRVAYHMTGPDGAEYPGWWRVLEVDVLHRIRLEDGFTGPDGQPLDDMPVSAMTVALGETTEGVTMTLTTTFPSRAEMDQLVEMGMVEGMNAAMSQIDSLL